MLYHVNIVLMLFQQPTLSDMLYHVNIVLMLFQQPTLSDMLYHVNIVLMLFQQPTLSDMTMQELNFSLLVEQMLSKIIDPAYRQLVVETFMVVSTILRRNPELVFHQAVHMDKVSLFIIT